jgi:NitT/TauT family transport system permease protein
VPLRSQRHAVGAASVLSVLLLWEGAVRLELIDSVFLPEPSVILARTAALLRSGVLVREAAASMQRIGLGFGLGAVVGITLAVLCHLSRFVEYALSPLVELIRGVAPLALLPAFMLLFGIGYQAHVAIIAWVAWVPVFLNALQGMKTVDPVFLKAARSIGSSRRQLVFKCILPATAPYILAGLRLGVGSAFLVLVAAEMLGANSGLGFYILESSQTFRIVEMYAAIVAIGALGLIVNGLFMLAARFLLPWSREAGQL